MPKINIDRDKMLRVRCATIELMRALGITYTRRLDLCMEDDGRLHVAAYPYDDRLEAPLWQRLAFDKDDDLGMKARAIAEERGLRPPISDTDAGVIVMPDLDEPWSGPCDKCGRMIDEDNGGECDFCGMRLCVTCYARHPCTQELWDEDHD